MSQLAIEDVGVGNFADMASSLSVMQRNALRLQILIENMMQLSKTGFEYTPLNATPVDIGNILDDVIKSMQPTAEDHKVELTLRLDFPESDLIIDGDANQLRQVFVNLISNAIKFTPRNGTVTVAAARIHAEGEFVEVKVQDTGIGIPPEEFHRIFERFFRASTAIEKSIPGFGIGLSLTHAMIRGHHGSITFDSTVGAGTVFTMTLPTRYISSRQVGQSI